VDIMNEYIKKPVAIEAIKWTGSNKNEVESFLDGNGFVKGCHIDIGTSEGLMVASIGDMIIKEPFDKERGFYPCKPDIFKLTYYTEKEYAESKES